MEAVVGLQLDSLRRETEAPMLSRDSARRLAWLKPTRTSRGRLRAAAATSLAKQGLGSRFRGKELFSSEIKVSITNFSVPLSMGPMAIGKSSRPPLVQVFFSKLSKLTGSRILHVGVEWSDSDC